MKFNVGDRVKLVDVKDTGIDSKYVGSEGVIKSVVDVFTSGMPYMIKMDTGYYFCFEKSLELVLEAYPKDCLTEHTTVTEDTLPNIVESGESREFNTGAKRDSSKGKGRPLLISPLFMEFWFTADFPTYGSIEKDWKPLACCEYLLWKYVKTKDKVHLVNACRYAGLELNENNQHSHCILSKLMEAGAEKKGERNWEKGMPVDVYLESAFRHLWKWQHGETDEDHAAALLFNLMGAIHTLIELERGNYPQELAPNWPDYSDHDPSDNVCTGCDVSIRNAVEKMMGPEAGTKEN